MNDELLGAREVLARVATLPRALVVLALCVGCLLGGCFLFGSAPQPHGAREGGPPCEGRPDPACGPDEETCMVDDPEADCWYRRCVPRGQCSPP